MDVHRGQWTFHKPLRVCFSTEAISYTSICSAEYPPPQDQRPGKRVLQSDSECPDGKEYCGYDVAIWKCAAYNTMIVVRRLQHKSIKLDYITFD